MTKRIREYIVFRKNKKTAKREFAAIAANSLPFFKTLSDRSFGIISFVSKLISTTKNMDGEEFVKTALSGLADALRTSDSHIIEILTYMAGLSAEDMQKILIHSMLETEHKQ